MSNRDCGHICEDYNSVKCNKCNIDCCFLCSRYFVKLENKFLCPSCDYKQKDSYDIVKDIKYDNKTNINQIECVVITCDNQVLFCMYRYKYPKFSISFPDKIPKLTLSAFYYGSGTMQGKHSQVYHPNIGWMTRRIKIYLCDKCVNITEGETLENIPDSTIIHDEIITFSEKQLFGLYQINYKNLSFTLREINRNQGEYEISSITFTL